MYEFFLITHSWMRWLVLIVGLASTIVLITALIKNKNPRSKLERILQASFVGFYDLQFTLGLTLYLGLSPFIRGIFQSEEKIMSNKLLRYWVVEHASMMLIAAAVLHIANSISKKQASVQKTRKILLAANLIWLFILLMAIPWPWLPHGRPLFRGF